MFFWENPLGFFITVSSDVFIFHHAFVSFSFHFFRWFHCWLHLFTWLFLNCLWSTSFLCCCIVSATDLRESFLLSVIFYFKLLPAFIKASLGPAVLLWRLQGFPLRFDTQTWPIGLFEPHSVRQKVLLGRFNLCVRDCYRLLHWLPVSSFELSILVIRIYFVRRTYYPLLNLLVICVS